VINGELQRLIELEAVFNFRDLGGYPTAGGGTTRWRTLYRADGIYRATEADVAAITSLGVRTVIDLRSPAELTERGRFEADGMAFHHFPVIETTWGDMDHLARTMEPAEFLLDRYRDMFSEGAHQLAAAVEVLSGDGLPAVFHCAAGKDRTGVLGILVLALCDVPDEVIAADYALSAEAMPRLGAWFRANDRSGGGRMENPPEAYMAAPAATARALLAELRAEHGTIERFVTTLGVAPSTVTALRSALVE
jgi:protein-tyrosine phosphatase